MRGNECEAKEAGTAGVNPNRAYTPEDLGISPQAGASARLPRGEPARLTMPEERREKNPAQWMLVPRALASKVKSPPFSFS